jgi:hypothetical protein
VFSSFRESESHLLHPVLPGSSALRHRLSRMGAQMPVCNLRIHHLALRVQSHSGLASLPSPISLSLLHAATYQAWRLSAGIILSATLKFQRAECGHHAACGDAIILGFIECIFSLARRCHGDSMSEIPPTIARSLRLKIALACMLEAIYNSLWCHM